MSTTSFVTTVVPSLTEAHSEPAVNPWLIGIITLAIFMAMLIGLLMFGAGRDHS